MTNDLVYPPGCKEIHVELTNEELIRRLKKIQQTYQDLEQAATEKYQELSTYLGTDIFLEHEHEDVKLLVACCLADIFRIYAPDSPFRDPQNLKKIFFLLANQLKGIKDAGSTTSFKYYFYLLENICVVNTFLLCLELDESQEIIVAVFENIFKIINEKTTPKVKTLLFDLLNPLLNEPDQISTKVLDILLARIIEPQKSNNKEAYALAVNLIKKGNEHFEFFVQNHLNNILLSSRGSNLGAIPAISFSAASTSLNSSHNSDENLFLLDQSASGGSASAHTTSSQFISDKLCLIIYELYSIRSALLELVMPQLEYKLKSSELKERREYTKLLSKMFSEKESKLSKQLPQLWEAFLDRFGDANEDIRRICVQHICDFLVQQADSIESITADAGNKALPASSHSTQLEQIIEQVKSRALDSEESIRYEVVQEILKAIKMEHNLITIDLLNILKDRTLDVKIKVRKSALQGLAALYKKIHSRLNSSRKSVHVVSWIPDKIMRIYFQDSAEDKLLVERCLNNSIVPYNLDAREKMAQLYYAYTTFDEYSILSMLEIMKNRTTLYKLMKNIIDAIDASPKVLPSTPRFNSDMAIVSQQLLDPKGQEFMKVFAELLRTNLNLRKYFKNLLQYDCSFSKSMQLIQLIFTNMNTLNQSQIAMGKRLIERMSSIIIDQKCVENLIELIEYKVKQRLTLKQRRLLSKQKKTKGNKSTKKTVSKRAAKNESDEEDDEENSEDENDDDETEADGEEEILDDEDDAENDVNGSGSGSNDKILLRHIDDDGTKGLKLLNMIMMVHSDYGFATSATYQKLFTFINSRKDYICSYTLKLLSTYYKTEDREHAKKQQVDEFNGANNVYLEKLKSLCVHGKPKQAKYAVHLIFNSFEKPKNEKTLHALYQELIEEANCRNSKTFVTCLVSIGHISFLLPQLVGKDTKEFISKTVVKEILSLPSTTQLIMSSSTDANVAASKRNKINLKLAGKWCENEEELPFSTRARIESIKLVIRWCLGMGKECTNILFTLKILIKILRENSVSESSPALKKVDADQEEDSKSNIVCEAEMSRVRAVCGSQLIKLAQEQTFRSLITAEYFHTLAKLIIDPVTNVRDIMIKKLHKGLKSNRLSFYYVAIFALAGLDVNRERRMRVKKIYTSLIKAMRLNEAKDAAKREQDSSSSRPRFLPELCLSYAVSLMAHNIRIESLKDEHKVKQIKECMSIILEPLVENPDGFQIAYIRKVLNKIKTHDDGLASAMLTSAEANSALSKTALQNLYHYNKVICFICEIFLFHMHSKSASYLTAKECQFDVKLPPGFYTPRNENDPVSSTHQQKIMQEMEEHFKVNENNAIADEVIIGKAAHKPKTTLSRIEITKISKVTRKRKSEDKDDDDDDENRDEDDEEDKEDEATETATSLTSQNNSKLSAKSNNSSNVSQENITLDGILKSKKTTGKNTSSSSTASPQSKRNKLDTSAVAAKAKAKTKATPEKKKTKGETKNGEAVVSAKKAKNGKASAKSESEDEKENESEMEEEEKEEEKERVEKKSSTRGGAKKNAKEVAADAAAASTAVVDSPASSRPRRAAAAKK